MGYSTYSDICTNVCHLWQLDNNQDTKEELTNFLINSLNPEECEPEEVAAEFLGWAFVDEAIELGRKKKLFGYEIVKGNRRVFLVNESTYANIGRYEWAVFGPDHVAVEEFVRDLALVTYAGHDDVVIDDIDTVNQTS